MISNRPHWTTPINNTTNNIINNTTPFCHVSTHLQHMCTYVLHNSLAAYHSGLHPDITCNSFCTTFSAVVCALQWTRATVTFPGSLLKQ